MHRKGRQDKAKSKLFSKLAREITVSAKMGLPDPSMNARLRAAIIAARAENMTADGANEIARRARGTPRIAGRLLRRVRDFALVAGASSIDRAAADRALTELEVDAAGLDAMRLVAGFSTPLTLMVPS